MQRRRKLAEGLAKRLSRVGLSVTPEQASKFSVGQRAAALRWAEKCELVTLVPTIKNNRPFFLDQYVPTKGENDGTSN